ALGARRRRGGSEKCDEDQAESDRQGHSGIPPALVTGRTGRLFVPQGGYDQSVTSRGSVGMRFYPECGSATSPKRQQGRPLLALRATYRSASPTTVSSDRLPRSVSRRRRCW